MAVISNISTSGVSSIINLDYLPERLLLGNVGQNSSFSNFSVVASGVQLMSVTNQDRFTALAKFDNQLYLNGAATVPFTEVVQYLRLAIGRINKATTIQGLDSGSSSSYPYNICAASTGMSNLARRAVESSINPSANGTFNDFEALFIEPFNFLRAQLTFENGFTDEYTPQEIAALFAAYNQTDFNGGLNANGSSAYLVIAGETPMGRISQAVIYASGTGSITVLKTDYVSL